MAGDTIPLPLPLCSSDFSIEEAICQRRSIRHYSDKAIEMHELSQLLFAVYGISDSENNFHTSPSAGAIYPMEIYVSLRDIKGIGAGVYRYIPQGHLLVSQIDYDTTDSLKVLCLNQRCVGKAQVNIIITAEFDRTTSIYGQRGL